MGDLISVNGIFVAIKDDFDFSLSYTRIPTLLKLSSERDSMDRLKKEIKQLNLKLSQVQTLLNEKDALLSQSRRYLLHFEFEKGSFLYIDYSGH